MRNRFLEKMLDICIVISSIVALIFVSGIREGNIQPFTFLSLFSMCAILSILYYGLECLYIWNRKRGVFFSLGKYIILTTITFSWMFSLLFMQPFYALATKTVQFGYIWMHYVLPICVILEYMVSDKGHFNGKFWYTLMILLLIYGGIVVSLGYFKQMYVYAFLNFQQLGYEIIIKECILIAVVMGIYAKCILAIDHTYKRKRR